VSDAKGTLMEVVERARLVHGTLSEKVCIPQKGIGGSKISNIKKMYYSYISKSLKDGRYYYGSTEDLEVRLLKHNSGQVKSTKGRVPFVIHFVEEHQNRSLAYRRELFYKSVDGYIYLKEQKII
jgi:putative endonuclease